MKTLDTTPGSEYAVKSAAGCDVYTPSGQVLCRIMPGILGSFCASTYVTCFSDAAAEVTLVSSGAPGGTGGDTLTISQALDAANRAESAAARAEAGASAAELQAQGATVANSAARAALAGAQAAETNAEASAQAAATSEGNATAAAQASATSEANAAASAQASATSEANADASADRAETAQVAAQASENNAAASADRAADAQAAAELAAATAQAPESLAAQAARPATMLLVRDELMSILGDASLFDIDTDGQKIIVHTDRLSDDKLAAVNDMLERFVPDFLEISRRNFILPVGYTALEWIQGSGTTRILYRGLPNVEIERFVSKAMKNQGGFLWMSYTTNNQASVQVVFQGDHIRCDCWEWNFIYPDDYSNSPIYEMDWDIVNAKLVLNGEEHELIKPEGAVIPIMSSLNFILGNDYGNFSSCVRCYRMTLYGGGACVFDLVPVLDELGNPCMYDLENKVTLYNALTGEFEYPGMEPEVSTFSMRRSITYAQLTDHGVRRLYRVPRGYNGTKEEYAMEHGFKPMVETDQPEDGYWEPHWVETAAAIVLEWVETDPPAGNLTSTE